MLLMQSGINIGIFITAPTRYYFKNKRNVNNKYSFEYLLLAIIQPLAVLTYCERFLL